MMSERTATTRCLLMFTIAMLRSQCTWLGVHIGVIGIKILDTHNREQLVYDVRYHFFACIVQTFILFIGEDSPYFGNFCFETSFCLEHKPTKSNMQVVPRGRTKSPSRQHLSFAASSFSSRYGRLTPGVYPGILVRF